MSFRHCCECRNLIYHKILLCQARFLIFLSFFISLPCSHELVMGRRTRHNISPDFILSNHFEQKIRFFCKKSCSTRKRVSRRVCVMAAGVCVSRGRGTIKTDENGNERKRTETNGKMGVPRDTPWVCGAQRGVARAKMCRRGMLGSLMATGVCVLRGRDA